MAIFRVCIEIINVELQGQVHVQVHVQTELHLDSRTSFLGLIIVHDVSACRPL